jgi:endogenous inhibitor of DNA gyrase (YacG/DUF329 family)
VAEVMINCPETGKPLSTGMSMDEQSFRSTQLSTNTTGPCPHCGKHHTWNKKDAYLK